MLLAKRFREMAFLTKGLPISTRRRAGRGRKKPHSITRAGSPTTSAYLKRRAMKPLLHDVIIIKAEGTDGAVEAALQWTDVDH